MMPVWFTVHKGVKDYLGFWIGTCRVKKWSEHGIKTSLNKFRLLREWVGLVSSAENKRILLILNSFLFSFHTNNIQLTTRLVYSELEQWKRTELFIGHIIEGNGMDMTGIDISIKLCYRIISYPDSQTFCNKQYEWLWYGCQCRPNVSLAHTYVVFIFTLCELSNRNCELFYGKK